MAPLPTEVFFATAVELNQRLIRKDFSAVELARAFGTRMESLGPGHQALALSLKDDGYQKAREVDKELKRGRTRGPLQGVPYSVVDLLSVAGRPTAWGSQLFAGQVFEDNAAIVDRLGRAGAVLISKLNAQELGGAGRPVPPVSSPAASAIAAGLSPYALGLESGGSLLLPAAAQRLTVFKPTYGLVSRAGAMPRAWTLDRIAILARSVEDSGHILHAVAGGDGRDHGSSGKSFHFAPQYEKPVSAMRIGFASSDFEAASTAPLRAVLDLWKRAGAALVEVQLPDFPLDAAVRTIQSAESSCAFADLIASGAVDRLADRRQVEGLRAGLEITAVEYLTAMRVRRLVQRAMNDMLAPLDLLVAPARSTASGDAVRSEGSSTTGRPHGLSGHLPAVDLAGLPALALPGPRTAGSTGSICLIAKAQCENTLLQAGQYLQSQSDWHRGQPPA